MPPYSRSLFANLFKLPGYLQKRYPWLPPQLLRLLGLVTARRKSIRLATPVPPDYVSIVMNTVPVPYDTRRYVNAIRIFYSIDCVNPSRFYTSLYAVRVRDDYDIVLVPHRSCIDAYEEHSIRAFYFAFYSNPLVHVMYPNAPKLYDVTFIGTLTEKRRQLLGELKRRLDIKLNVVKACRHNMVAYYNMSKIVLNISRMNEINVRVFEALGSGAFLLTDRSKEVEELFRDGKHLVMYDDVVDLVEKIIYYLKHEDERKAIAQEGYREVVTRHTIFHRIAELLDILAAQQKALENPWLELLIRRREKYASLLRVVVNTILGDSGEQH